MPSRFSLKIEVTTEDEQKLAGGSTLSCRLRLDTPCLKPVVFAVIVLSLRISFRSDTLQDESPFYSTALMSLLSEVNG